MLDGEASTQDRAEAVAAPTAGFGRGFVQDAWYLAGLGRDLKCGAMARQLILGQPIVLGRDPAGEAFALRDICPHRAAPLSAGQVVEGADGAALACPYHGWTFRTRDGACTRMPSLVESQARDTERVRVRRYPLCESQGLVWIWMAADDRRGAATPDHAAPMFDGVAGGGPKIVERTTFDSHVDHAVVGLMDPAHGPYVHQQWWWRSSRRQLDKAKAFEPRPHGFAMTAHAPSKNSRAYRILGGAPVTEITFQLPGLRWEHVRVGVRQVLALTCLTPVDANATRVTQIIWSDHWAFALLRPLIRVAARRFLQQDGDMVKLQNEGLRYDPALLWIDDADRQAKWYGALKREWAVAHAEGRAFSNPVKPVTLRWRS